MHLQEQNLKNKRQLKILWECQSFKWHEKKNIRWGFLRAEHVLFIFMLIQIFWYGYSSILKTECILNWLSLTAYYVVVLSFQITQKLTLEPKKPLIFPLWFEDLKLKQQTIKFQCSFQGKLEIIQ